MLISALDESNAKTLGDVERLIFNRGILNVIGLDEAGRGPLAGPVEAAAALITLSREGSPNPPLHPKLNDSKKINEKTRREICADLKRSLPGWCAASASAEEIDEINIRSASGLAMRRALEGLLAEKAKPLGLDAGNTVVIIDGDFSIPCAFPALPLVKGDARSLAIAAASVLAKTLRDELMEELDAYYPQYGFKEHKGYPTQKHKEAVKTRGLSPVHRKSFNCD